MDVGRGSDIVEQYLKNLITIGSIEPGQKISTAHGGVAIDENSIFQGWYRGWNGDNRDKSVTVICREVHTLLEILRRIMECRHLSSRDRDERIYQQRLEELKSIRVALTVCQPGINNMRCTYAGNKQAADLLEKLVEDIRGHLSGLSQLLKSLGDTTEIVDIREIKKNI